MGLRFLPTRDQDDEIGLSDVHVFFFAAPVPEAGAEISTVPMPPVDDPTTRLLLDTFPGAEVVAIRTLEPEKPETPETPEQMATRERQDRQRRAEEAAREAAEGPKRADRARRKQVHDAAIKAGPPAAAPPREGRTETERVADACRAEHAAWTDHVVATQPLERQYKSYMRCVEDVMPYEETSRLLLANGWSHYPQARDGERRPIKGQLPKERNVKCKDGRLRMLPDKDRYGNVRMRDVFVLPSKLYDRPPTPGLRADWIKVAPRETNVALLTCAANLHNWVLDIDVEDGLAVGAIRALVEEHLGVTPFDRYRDDSAKVALMFRHASEDTQAFRYEVIRLDDLGAVEFLGDRKQITWHGRHWQTGAVFRSHGPLPGMDEGATPDLAPVVTVEHLRALKAAIRQTFGVAEPVRAPRSPNSSAQVVHGEVDGVAVRRPDRAAYLTARHREDGLVHDDRDDWLFAHAGTLARLNFDLDEERFVALLLEDARANIAIGGSWSEAKLEDKCREKGPRALRNARDWYANLAQRKPREPVVVDGRALVPAPHVPALSPDHALRAVLPLHPVGEVKSKREFVRTEPDPAAAKARALLHDRTALRARVAADIEGALTDWVRCLYDVAMGADRVDLHELQARATAVMLVRGPTGSGKSTTFLRVCQAEKARAQAAGFEGRVRIAMAMPSYALIDEVAKRLDPAVDGGAPSETEAARLAQVEAAGRAMGLDVMQYRGKTHTCGRKEEHDILAKAGIGTTGMCKSKTWEEPRDAEGHVIEGAKDVQVEHPCVIWARGECEHQLQKARVAQSDLVLLPTAYVTLPIPEQLKNVTALVVDENVTSQFARSAVLDPDWLKLERRAPRLSKKEKAAAEEFYADRPRSEAHDAWQGMLMQDRREACRIAMECIARGEDVANGMVDYKFTYRRVTVAGLELASTALSVSGRSTDVHDVVTYDIDARRAVELAGREKSTGLLQEIRFWRLVIDRIERILSDRAAAAEHAENVSRVTRLQLLPLVEHWDRVAAERVTQACGDRDARVRITTREVDGQVVRRVRMSWRARNSFAHLPTLLLDASADEHMLEKVFPGRPIDVRCADPVPLHMRVVWLPDTVSLRSRLPYKHQTVEARCGAARTLDSDRRLVAGLAGAFAHSRMVVATGKQVEVAMHTCWLPPANTDHIHDGAVVGLNFARHHEAAYIGGQTDLPVDAVDDEVAVWTYDDPEPEAPVDALGTGFEADGETPVRCPLVDVRVAMRDGSDVVSPMRVYSGTWARRVQVQSREEPQRQAIGRVRPVYRDGQTPSMFLHGAVIPEGLIVDEIADPADVRNRLAHYAEAHALGCLPIRGGASGLPATPRWDAILRGCETTAEGAPLADYRRGLSRLSYDRGNGRRLTVEILAHENPMAAITRFEAACRDSVYDPETADIRLDPRAVPLRQADVRPVDAKMTKLLGSLSDRPAAIAAVMDEVARRDKTKAWHPDVLRARLRAEAKAILLTVRPRTEDDPAHRLDTLVVPDASLLAPKRAPRAAKVAPVTTLVAPPVEVANVEADNDDSTSLVSCGRTQVA